MNKKLLVTSMLALATATAAFARPHHHGPRGRDIAAGVAGAVIGNVIGNIINPNPGYVVTPAPVVVPPAPVVVTPPPAIIHPPAPVVVPPGMTIRSARWVKRPSRTWTPTQRARTMRVR